MLDALKSFVPLSIKRRVLLFLRQRNMRLPQAPRAFVFLAADYGNIGDLAFEFIVFNQFHLFYFIINYCLPNLGKPSRR